jgi:hypothetical protein
MIGSGSLVLPSRRRFAAPQDKAGSNLQSTTFLLLRSGVLGGLRDQRKLGRAAASRSITAAMLLFALFPTQVLACSCMRGDPEITRRQASVIIEGKVVGVKREGDINGRVTARIAVTRQVKGKTPRTVTVSTRGNSAACGVSFKSGQTGEFLLVREQGRYSTNLCLMMGARQ